MISHCLLKDKYLYTSYICPWWVSSWILLFIISQPVTMHHKWRYQLLTFCSPFETTPPPFIKSAFSLPSLSSLSTPPPPHFGETHQIGQYVIQTGHWKATFWFYLSTHLLYYLPFTNTSENINASLLLKSYLHVYVQNTSYLLFVLKIWCFRWLQQINNLWYFLSKKYPPKIQPKYS